MQHSSLFQRILTGFVARLANLQELIVDTW